MIKKDYWDLSDNPHTELKLDMLKKYLSAWADILLGQYRSHSEWKDWKTLYYIDCFSGRGKYHKNGIDNCILGSPIIALENAQKKQKYYKEQFQLDIEIKCRFVEAKKKFANELVEFCKPYIGIVDFKVIPGDFNNVIEDLVLETGYSPAFFFVDAGGIKELKKESVVKIVSKKGARDIMLNYIIGGPRRIGGLSKKVSKGYTGKNIERYIKTIQTYEEFSGIHSLEIHDKADREVLEHYVRNVIEGNNAHLADKEKLETIAYDMKHPDKDDWIYYLLFSSRKDVAIRIMKQIFSEAKKTDYAGQTNIFDIDGKEFDI